MKIYTKKGDKGRTDLLTKRVSKTDLRISVNGAFDEVMATLLLAKQKVRDPDIKNDLDHVYDLVFSICHEIALIEASNHLITDGMVLWMEKQIDVYDSKMEPLHQFIKLDQNEAASFLNLARVTTRKAERELSLLNEQENVNPKTLALVNRISDYLFTIARLHNEEKI
ncbi:MAG: cob(I)yrinic acid a,c-diamide adenosyltransferase [Acholeplasmataceae bacterium]|nr:cob(I)yrinic acid a,c-diamide adenosyltransferase [Acholeplasmataceae bacterium]